MEQTIQQPPLIGMTLDQTHESGVVGRYAEIRRQAACRMAI